MDWFLAVLGLHCRAGFPLVVESGVTLGLWCAGFPLQRPPRCGAQTLGCPGFVGCGTWTGYLWLPGSRAPARQLWCVGLGALWHVGSSQIRDRTCVSCISRWILYHWATREALGVLISKMISSFQILGLCCMVLTLALCVERFYKHRFIYFSQTFCVLNDHVPILPVREFKLKEVELFAQDHILLNSKVRICF